MRGVHGLAALVIVVLLALPCSEGRSKKASHGRPAAEQDMRLKRIDCERMACQGLKGEARATCTYRCVSPECFDEVYAHDPLEEGEVDTERARAYSFCFKKAYRVEQDAKMDKLRREAAERRAMLAQKRDASKAPVDLKKNVSATITQKTYFKKVLARFGYSTMKSADTPMDSTLKISLADRDGDEELGLLGPSDKKLYMEITGSRYGFANAVAQLGRVMSKPRKSHLAAAKRVLKCIAGTMDRGLVYENKTWTAPGFSSPISPHKIVTYADSDWGGDADSRKSMSGYPVFKAGGVISFRAKLQRIQALSGAEAEYVALSDASREMVDICDILRSADLLEEGRPLLLLSDSSAAIAMSQSKGVNHCIKHIALRHHFVRDLTDNKVVKVLKIGTACNPADVLTKATDKDTFLRHADTCTPRVRSNK